MTKLGICSLLAGLLVWFSGPSSVWAEAPGQAPEFKEVYDTLRAHLAGTSEAELNRTAVEALVSALSPKVALVAGKDSSNALSGAALVIKSNLFDGAIGYVRIAQVSEGVDKAIRETAEKLGATNKLNGVVLDLRYAGGYDYAAAAAAADLFLRKEQPLLDWGHGMVRSKEKSEPLAGPVAVLVNRQTRGAAEALAAALRESGAALLLGGQTAGQALIAEEFPLKNGERLRVAIAPVKLGDGTPLSTQGVKPDITVDVNPQAEQAYFADAFKELPRTNTVAASTLVAGSSTNRTRRVRFNEAELVRERKEGFNPDLVPMDGHGAEGEKPLVYDPALARALDVLKGLAVVRQAHS